MDEAHDSIREGRAAVGGTVGLGLVDLNTYDQYGEEGHEKKKNSKKFKPNTIEVLDYYDDRSLIENTGFRELKQGWHLTSYPKKTEDAVGNHALLTVTVFNLCNAYRTEAGQDLTDRGIRRLRRQEGDAMHKVVVFAGEYYAIFDVKELMTILGKPPKYCFCTDPARTRATYGLT